MTRRLFLFAGYDAGGIIDASLIGYVRALAAHGDVIVVMDSNCAPDQLAKITPYVIHATASRHGEYDFGSYKRAYIYAHDAEILDNYDFLYMVNDSVYGPLRDIGPILNKMEQSGADAFGLVAKKHPTRAHIQSWFIGCRPSVFRASWFDEFMRSITKQSDKGAITRLYEQGFTARVAQNGLSWHVLWWVRNRGVYNNIKRLYRAGMPFMKKVAFSRRRGALGGQIAYVLRHINPATATAIMENARRTWGTEYTNWLLTRNPFKILYRNIKYSLRKIFIEGI